MKPASLSAVLPPVYYAGATACCAELPTDSCLLTVSRWCARLRSLHKSDKFYQRENAPGDAPYWRGYIWMPINYLALQALHTYAALPGPHQRACEKAYTELRANLLRTVLASYTETGFFWEQYDDKTGAGRRSHPFTGWTALVVNIMGEVYD